MTPSVFTDGGVVLHNPSIIGGTWAWKAIHMQPERCASGFIRPGEQGLPDAVSNNQAEFYAMLCACEAMPEGWNGTVYCDSQVTITRFVRWYHRLPANAVGLPEHWVERAQKKLRAFGKEVLWVQLAGHPTPAQLRSGTGRGGAPVSIENVWCDTQCKLQAAVLLDLLCIR